jgi:tetratricopeptide (TPR) repeat protein
MKNGSRLQDNGCRFHVVAAAALLAWDVAALATLAAPSQNAVPQRQRSPPLASPSGAAFYLGRGEDFSSDHDYDRAIADYSTAIRLKPDYAEAYNDRGFAYYLKGDAERANRRLHAGDRTAARLPEGVQQPRRGVHGAWLRAGRKRWLTSIAPSP